MRKIITAALALTLVGATAAATAASAQPYSQGRYDRQVGYGNSYGNSYGYGHSNGYGYGHQHRGWSRGDRLPRGYGGYGVDYRRHHLRQPPRGYHWVQAGNDYVLAALATGLILEVINGR